MDIFVFLFIAYIVIQVIAGPSVTRLISKLRTKPASSSSPVSSVKDRRPQTGAPATALSEVAADELAKVRAHVRTISSAQAGQWSEDKARMQVRLDAAQTRTMTKNDARDAAKRNANIPDFYDQNRTRRSDWGQRARPEFFSMRNLLIGILAVLILYLFTQIPSHLIL